MGQAQAVLRVVDDDDDGGDGEGERQSQAVAATAVPEAEVRLTHEGRERSAIVVVPQVQQQEQEQQDQEQQEQEHLPVVFVFHGGGGNAQQMRDHCRMDELGAREGFITVYPNGAGRFSKKLLTWNCEPGKCGYSADHNVDDVGFVLRLLDYILKAFPANPHRVYATGLSNGGMFCYRLASDRLASTRFAAIAPVGGVCLCSATFQPQRQVPVMHIHSVDDPRALFEGGEGPPFPLTRRTVTHSPVMEVVQQWTRLNGCDGANPVTIDTRSSPSPSQQQRREGRELHTATLLCFPPTAQHRHAAQQDNQHRPQPTTTTATSTTTTATTTATAAEVAYARYRNMPVVFLWRLTGAGHVWPSMAAGERARRAAWVQRFCGSATDVIDANDEMWRFFQQHQGAG
ncbi:hypothetical protein PTSG_09734 [Salpingoeca rosetta]|uniref:Feruloyl esterase n=1 Tax=Salpingoeca rosetta (strain ATCC 50818 / BSB-021) TaxID=946362 RepID=F2UNW5_SALR5|nr:uncharacterized protein PTSG_09734 [Salpingoeca rosetta]EGD79320.1 hypothetical protein PTSG_09734 [Salpingoeca rosetta]|eukprot:XP_004989089.1 hypothetical protein PTSG_09734 [Salpingoeca rosetta]